MSADRRTYDLAKRVLDVMGASIALVVLAPVLAFAALIVSLFLGRPVIFAQERPGRDGRPFILLKFRSMLSVNPNKGRVSNEERMTKFGRMLRATSIDELPSLWNILVGHMSFVGPRPLRMAYMDRYSAEQLKRQTVRPGLTGLAQVSGRNAVSWDERLRLDQKYVDQRSLSLDLRILLLTLKAVIVPRGVAADGQATMSEFFGPETTSRLRLTPLADEHLDCRVEWLNNPVVRTGISIDFVAEIEPMREWFVAIQGEADRWDWVGVDAGGNPVSMCGLRLTGESRASLYVYVDPRRLGEGIGRDTMSILIANARRMRIEYLELETPVNNKPARLMYERLGFSVDGTVANGGKLHLTKIIRTGHANG